MALGIGVVILLIQFVFVMSYMISSTLSSSIADVIVSFM